MIEAVEPRTRLWTRAEFYQLADLGFFQGQRAELIEGKIMVLSPQNGPHASTVDRVAEVLRQGLGSGFWVRMQLPLNFTPSSDPEPDVSVVAGQRDDYTDHPTSALLLVEVSDTTLAYDRRDKASLYARAGIGDYWIVNLVDLQLEVLRNPVPDLTQPYGHGYAHSTIHRSTASVTPLATPALLVRVADLLP
jgi:Uma2 family endonuclease